MAKMKMDNVLSAIIVFENLKMVNVFLKPKKNNVYRQPLASKTTNDGNMFTSYAKINQSYNPEAHNELMEFVSNNSLDDADAFIKQLMRESTRHKTLALRILEVRSAYIKKDFEWDNLKKLSFKMVEEANKKLMREYVLETSHIEDDK